MTLKNGCRVLLNSALMQIIVIHLMHPGLCDRVRSVGMRSLRRQFAQQAARNKVNVLGTQADSAVYPRRQQLM